ncbi:MAG: hypothetical protein CVT64_06800 [Actinobacteria bacterium HGW-Actinobacteria-4]|nr:MAG: hypothetical protein CVT64_06800 [Actinobacteria bacterium HGW-Actinobacteria-4]
MTTLRERISQHRDDGSALVAAVAVSLIGLALTTVVVSQVISLANDTARDRLRTSEVHAAESGLDLALQELESSLPCSASSYSPMTVGDSNSSSIVNVSIAYFDADDVELTGCAGGVIQGSPVTAHLVSTATPLRSVPGIDPVRSIEAIVNLKPQIVADSGAAIFSAGSFSTGAGFTLEPVDSDVPASVWIDSGNWACNTSVTIDGDIVVANGTLTLSQNNCQIKGHAWARNGYTSCCTPSVPFHIHKSLTVRHGNVTVNNPTRIGGDVSINGIVTGWTGHYLNSTIGGTTCSNNIGSPCTSFIDYTPRGLPEVDYKPADWDGFNISTRTAFGEQIVTSWNLTSEPAWMLAETRNNFVATGNPTCTIPAHRKQIPVAMPSVPTVFDLRGCTRGFDANGGLFTMDLYADTAIFAHQFQVSNGLVVRSGDGGAHQLWLIVPEGGTPDNGIAETTCRSNTPNAGYSYCPGNISFSSNAVNVQEPVSVYMYTPRTLYFNNSSNTRGQLYAGAIQVGQGNGVFKYVGIGVPGVDMGTTTSSASGYRVEIVTKREIRE